MISFTYRAFYHFCAFSGKTALFLVSIICLFLSSTHSSRASFEKIDSFTKAVFSCTKLTESDENGSFPNFLLNTFTFLFQLSLRISGNLETKIHSVPGVSRAFQAVLLEGFSHFNTKM